ncbi:MAG: hypothetical protein V4532_07705 [Pseudomonadota bacterium]
MNSPAFSFRAALSRVVLQPMLLVGALALSGSAVWAQSQSPTIGQESPPPESQTMPAVTGKTAVSTTLDDAKPALTTPVVRPLARPLGIRDGLITEVGSGRPVSEGSRILRLPGKCSPKTNSLDCVADAAPTPTGANVSSRVRNSVIGEVGAGRAATEGSGKAKSKATCTPQAGKLTCEP